MTRTRPRTRAAVTYVCALAVSAALAVLSGANAQEAAPKPAPGPPPDGVLPPKDQPEPDLAEEGPDEAEADLVLKDGRQVSGVLLLRTPDSVILRLNGTPTAFPGETIVSIDEKPPVSQRYREMRAAIDDSDTDQLLQLVEWLRLRRKYTLALNEVTGILAREPDNPDAQRLHTWLSEQIKLRTETAKARKKQEDKARQADKPREFPVLSARDINLIRVYEVDLGNPPKMIVPPATISKLIESYGTNRLMPTTQTGRDALFRRRPSQVLEIMFRLQARELYEQVQVTEDPGALKLFRERVHNTWLLNGCATSQCHGGEDAGRLWLATKNPGTDATAYTNFLILDRFRLEPREEAGAPPRGDPAPDNAGPAPVDAAPAPVGVPLINYDDPASSPLLQLGLPKSKSRYPHPEISPRRGQRGFNPIFQSPEDRRYQDAIAWIQSMYRPRPSYPVNYTPPVPNPGAEPNRPEAEESPPARDGTPAPKPPSPKALQPR